LTWEGTCVGFADDFLILATSSAENHSMCAFYPKPTYLILAPFFLSMHAQNCQLHNQNPVPGDLDRLLPDSVWK
jgi:hypothetical protein